MSTVSVTTVVTTLETAGTLRGMDLGVMLPTGFPGSDARLVVDWARRAEESGAFTSLAVADRFAYANLDSLMSLAAAAAVTERVRLMTYIAVAPTKPAAVFAKEVATLAALAPGRVTLGVGVGARPRDYEDTGTPWAERGRLLDEALAAVVAMKDRPDAEQCAGPDMDRDLEVLIGGTSPPALRRMVEHGHGFAHGGLRAEIFGFQAMAARGAWEASGRDGAPRVIASTWVASSTDPDDAAQAWQDSYFQQGAPPEEMRDGISRGEEAVRLACAAFAAAGADEVVLYPCVADLDELEWLIGVAERMPSTEELVAMAPEPQLPPGMGGPGGPGGPAGGPGGGMATPGTHDDASRVPATAPGVESPAV